MVVCRKVIYVGRVQGVGFRYTAQAIARSLAVAGHVQNLASGQVELVAEGEAGVVDELLRLVAVEMTDYIKWINITEEPPQGLSGFHIRR